jgi:hypothetical protein
MRKRGVSAALMSFTLSESSQATRLDPASFCTLAMGNAYQRAITRGFERQYMHLHSKKLPLFDYNYLIQAQTQDHADSGRSLDLRSLLPQNHYASK